MLNAAGDKSFVDDLVASGYCKCESSLCCYEALRFILCFYDLFFPVLRSLLIHSRRDWGHSRRDFDFTHGGIDVTHGGIRDASTTNGCGYLSLTLTTNNCSYLSLTLTTNNCSYPSLTLTTNNCSYFGGARTTRRQKSYHRDNRIRGGRSSTSFFLRPNLRLACLLLFSLSFTVAILAQGKPSG